MPQAAVAAVLLQHARLAFGEALRQLAAELLQRRIETRVGAPAHVASPIEHFLRTHLQNQVRMRAHEHAVARHVAQERIERRAVAVLADRIDPDEDAVAAQQLLTHPVGDLVGVDRSLDVEADGAQRLAMPPSRVSSSFSVAQLLGSPANSIATRYVRSLIACPSAGHALYPGLYLTGRACALTPA